MTFLKLIESIVLSGRDFKLSGDVFHKIEMKKCIQELAQRLKISSNGAIIFANIFFQNTWGKMPDRQELMTHMPGSDITIRLRVIYELEQMNLIYCNKLKDFASRTYGINETVLGCIFENKNPIARKALNHVSHEKLSIYIEKWNNSEDLWIMYQGKRIGIALEKADRSAEYEIIIHGKIIKDYVQRKDIEKVLNYKNNRGELGLCDI